MPRVAAGSRQEGTSEGSDASRTRAALSAIVSTARAVADADPGEIEQVARQFGESRRYLAPVAWAAGALVLLVRGVKLLILNWRLTLVELVPAGWLWFVMWDLKQHALRGAAFRTFTLGGMIALSLLAVAVSIASFWCNTVFAFAISAQTPRIRPAARQARPFLRLIVAAGVVMGAAVTVCAVAIPRLESRLLYVVAIGALYAVMLTSFVVVPARILGLKKQKLPRREAIGRVTLGGALSAIAMTPGFALDRLGLLLIGIPYLRVLGFILLSVGTALYAAGMSSVRAVKLTMKLDTPAG